MDSEEDILQQEYMRTRDSRAYQSTDDIVHWQEERQKGTVARAIGVCSLSCCICYVANLP